MKQDLRNWTNSKHFIGLFVWFFVASMIAYGSQARARQPSQSDGAVAADESLVVAESTQCPAAQHRDPGMGMCMPDEKPPKQSETDKVASPQGETPSPGSMPADAPTVSSSQTADRPPNPAMNMVMPGDGKANNGLMFHLNQFMLYSDTSGPRGETHLTGPGMWMLLYDHNLSPQNQLSINVMGTPEQLTVGAKGTPQLLQTDNIDAMHAHDDIMWLEFRDIITLSTMDSERLTFLFAPRGEAATGPVPFMHRESAEGNPDAPLGHTLQDGFHDASTVFGVEYGIDRTTVEATAFSGQNISWPFPLHGPDSYGLRVIQSVDDQVSIGASYADALLPSDTGGAAHNQFISAWLTTSHQIDGDTLKSSLIWGQGHAVHSAPLNSFLEEAVCQQGSNKFYGRAEILQITPQQLELVVSGGAADPKWVKALTVGYERTVLHKDDLSLFVGGSYTKDFTPAEFQPAYGSDPRGIKVYLRIAFDGQVP